MSAPQINVLLDLWVQHSSSMAMNHLSTPLGDVKWQRYKIQYTGDMPDLNPPPWMRQTFEVWFRDVREVTRIILGNPSFAEEMDLRPFREFSTEGDERQYQDFMSGDWAWDQADIISEDEKTHGSTFVPIILGSDKTTVSVGTGNNEYYPLYLSIGNVRNGVHHAHWDALVLVGFLAIPKSGRSNLDEADALNRSRAFTETLFCESTLAIMWDEYGIVGDLVPFTNDFPRANIHKLIAPDILHQLVKGCFKDHLVDWVEAYLKAKHGTKDAERILDDIDRRIAAVAPFTGLQQFPQGCGFKQWTGNDSKALMKVYIAAIEGHVPPEIKTLEEIEDALARFHKYREVFKTGEVPVVATFSLPCQHAAKHYPELIRLFGAPNGLCSSITECKHIKAVKEPYRRSSKYKALGQMLLTNQRLDKIAASRVDFASRGMLEGTCLSSVLQSLALALPPPEALANENAATGEEALPTSSNPATASTQADNDEAIPDDFPPSLSGHVELARTPQRKRSRTVGTLAEEIGVPHLSDLLCRFLFENLFPDDTRHPSEIPLAGCPRFEGRIAMFNSASARFYAPSDLSGLRGMQTEYIRSAPNWRKETPRFDCVFVGTSNNDLTDVGMHAYNIARVLAFFSFAFRGVTYPCAVIRWFDKIGDAPDEDTGMWMVCPSSLPNHSPHFAIIYTDSIYRAAHLIPIYGTRFIPRNIEPHHSYDAFQAYYVNKYADHHAFEIAR
ncbi:hypothetical protein HYDPIDRAFT_33907 [Hydnomerulius pinastri MD-312]|uniref:Uncharacterized protein n=1 Tax=Hydnomerulius pinastri MD-312 TaxID=994086 RepID=A0A0C9VZ53_9AGAM|nr:hypothetical protein HYDPIDRAFT_33907 [Hydnomerulius pinastri MD-312]